MNKLLLNFPIYESFLLIVRWLSVLLIIENRFILTHFRRIKVLKWFILLIIVVAAALFLLDISFNLFSFILGLFFFVRIHLLFGSFLGIAEEVIEWFSRWKIRILLIRSYWWSTSTWIHSCNTWYIKWSTMMHFVWNLLLLLLNFTCITQNSFYIEKNKNNHFYSRNYSKN